MILIATAVELEAAAVRAGLPPGAAVQATAVGVGPAAAAAGTARLLALAEAAGKSYSAVISAGIGGGFGAGAVVLGRRAVAADLGADSPEGFIPIDDLGFGTAILPADGEFLAALQKAMPEARAGDILTVSTVTGTAARAGALRIRFPDAVAEGMEGYGVACAARDAGVPFAELRAISNPVGPRDRGAWRIPQALAALTKAVAAVATVVG